MPQALRLAGKRQAVASLEKGESTKARDHMDANWNLGVATVDLCLDISPHSPERPQEGVQAGPIPASISQKQISGYCVKKPKRIKLTSKRLKIGA